MLYKYLCKLKINKAYMLCLQIKYHHNKIKYIYLEYNRILFPEY